MKRPLTPESPVRDIIAVNVRRLRKEQKLKQSGLAARAGISEGLVARVELGSAGVRLDTIVRLASALGVEAWTLLKPPPEDGGS